MNVDSQKLIVCDVCDTLYRSNTTFDFIRFVVEKEKWVQRSLLLLVVSRKSPLFYFLVIAGKLFHQDLIRKVALRFLKGKSKIDLDLLAQQFYSDFLESRANMKVFEKILTNGVTTTLLLSSSIDPVIATIAHSNKLRFYSSELKWKQGKATGTLRKDMTGKKHEVVNKILSEEHFNRLQVITDNRSDWELVKLADERFIVIKNESEKIFWKSLDPIFIEV